MDELLEIPMDDYIAVAPLLWQSKREMPYNYQELIYPVFDQGSVPTDEKLRVVSASKRKRIEDGSDVEPQ